MPFVKGDSAKADKNESFIPPAEAGGNSVNAVGQN